MSLPGLDFGTWEEAQQRKRTLDSRPDSGRAAARTPTHKAPIQPRPDRVECRKCIQLRERRNGQQHRYQTHYQKIGLFPPQLRPSHESTSEPLQCNQCKRDAAAAATTKNILNAGVPTDGVSLSPSMTVLQLPKRNLSFQRQESKEVQTRALVSQVAEYYESYVREMNLSKHFLDNTIVTSIHPLHISSGNQCPNARWIVYG